MTYEVFVSLIDGTAFSTQVESTTPATALSKLMMMINNWTPITVSRAGSTDQVLISLNHQHVVSAEVIL